MTETKRKLKLLPLDIVMIVGGLVCIISAFISYVDASTLTLTGWDKKPTCVFDLYHHMVGGKLLFVSWIRAAAVAVPVCGLISIICGLLSGYYGDKRIYILEIIAGTVALIAILMFMLMGPNVDIFGGMDAVTYGTLLESGLYKLELSTGFYIGFVGCAAVFIGGLLNSKKLLQ